MRWVAILSGPTKDNRGAARHGTDKSIGKRRKGKHLTREERVVIEGMSRGGRLHIFSSHILY